MPSQPLRTAAYNEDARRRLGEAVKDARKAAGFRAQRKMADASGGSVGLRSLSAIEAAEPTVGSHILEEVGRFLGRYLIGWDKTLPKRILEGEHPPEPTPITAAPLIPPAHRRHRQLIQAVVENLQGELGAEEALQLMAGVIAEMIAENRRNSTTPGEDADAAG